jgi:hypothetical protein
VFRRIGCIAGIMGTPPPQRRAKKRCHPEAAKAPSSNIQAPEKHQASNTKVAAAFGAWDLIILWCLELGIWSF